MWLATYIPWNKDTSCNNLAGHDKKCKNKVSQDPLLLMKIPIHRNRITCWVQLFTVLNGVIPDDLKILTYDKFAMSTTP